MSRIRYTAKNIAFGYMSNIITALLGFVARKVFIMRLSGTLLGVNGFYTGILSALSLAELGIGTALNFSLYKPVAEGDTEKIKSYMALYRKAYRIIAIIVAAIGLCIAPFLQYIIKDPGSNSMTDLTLYYFIFLFNSVSSYFVAYKYSLVNAEQKTYIQTNITTVTKMISVTAQIIVLFITANFYCYLLTDAAIQLLQKFFVSWYLNRKYPYLTEKNITPLTREETGVIVKKTKALMWIKIGDTARLQTDSIIITAFVSVATTGVVDNFTMVISTISNFVNIIFNSALPGFGNLIATESRQKQKQLFKVYRFFAIWIYGYSAVGFVILLSPLITIMYGKEWALAQGIIALIIADYYFKGDRIVLSNFETAAGVFEPEKYIPMIEGAVNLVLSIWLAIRIGLAGVYVGTVVSGLIGNVIKPWIVYKYCFHESTAEYFKDTVKYVLVLALQLAVLLPLGKLVLQNVTIATFLIMFVIITLVFQGIFFLFFSRSPEFLYLKEMVLGRLKARR
ncbi:MAG: polysaccharide biosynthesis protein [Butyrivibrio sp.]|jgi:O-antigen/teichoic acid export membrane protein|nr:polysaccharide biosynthesis protein [Butyrivibrio sp.]